MSIVNRGKWLRSPVKIKGANKCNRLRFMLEGPWPRTSFVFCSLTMHELRNRNASISLLYEHA